MTLLDRFRAQPRQKHPDAAVRLAFVQEIPIDARDLLAEMARDDADPRVRRAAVSKLLDPARLADVASHDADETVRVQAIAMLRDVALEAFEGVAEPDSLAAAEALAAVGDMKALAAVAKSAPRVTVAHRARSLVTDHHMLGSIARHSEHELVRREAFNGLTDAREILSVALNSEFREPAVTAVERITDREALEQIAARAKNKSASKRARAIAHEIDERRAREREAGRLAHRNVPQAAGETAAHAAADRTVAASSQQAASDLIVVQTEPAQMDVVQTDVVRTQAVTAEPVRPRPVPAERAGDEPFGDEPFGGEPFGDERVGAERARDGPAGAEAGWAAPTQHEPARAGAVEGEGSEAGHDAERAEAGRLTRETERERAQRQLIDKEAERSRVRLAELAEHAARVGALDDLSGARRQIMVIRREWEDLIGRTTVDPVVIAQYTEADARFVARETAAREADRQARAAALVKLQQVSARLEALASQEDLTLRAGDRALRDIRMALGAIPPLPSRRDYEEIVRRLKAVQAALAPKIQELREVASWQRWANIGIQEQLCERMEALKALEDPEEIARQVKELQLQWRQAADVPRAQGEALWRRFKAAHDEAWTKCEAHFAAQAEIRAQNLAKKTALCERAEALAESTKWIETAEDIKTLQAEWKTIGPVSRGREKAIWERFRAACDRFFTRRYADLAERKKRWAENLAKKEDLIARVEALAESNDWEATAAEIKRIQAAWKTIGPVKKSRSEALWRRFRGACDHFFTRYAQRHDVARGERVAAREALVAEMEALAGAEPVDGDAPPPNLLARVRELSRRWDQELSARGVDRERAAVLNERFAAASQKIMSRWPAAFAGTDLDPDANRKRMELLVHRIEDLANSLAGSDETPDRDAALSPASRLAAMLKESWAANTIGGKADNEVRFRAVQEELRQAQASWARIGPVPEATRRTLADRFQRAIRRINERTNLGRLVGARR